MRDPFGADPFSFPLDAPATLHSREYAIGPAQEGHAGAIAAMGTPTMGTSGDDDAIGTTADDTWKGLGGNDRYQGLEGRDTIGGGKGRDILEGNGGKDSLRGDAGRDILNGGAGGDTLTGGLGRDTATYRDATAPVRADLVRPESNTGDAAGDIYKGIENLTGGDFADELFGDSGKNTISGGKGNDRLGGREGNDRLRGDDGNDRLTGDSGNDILIGGKGRDTLIGDSGNDILRGKAGRDTFVFNGGADRIRDFRDETLKLEDSLWGSAMLDNGQIIAFASVTGGDTIFDFGNGNTLTLDGYTDLTALESLIGVI